MMHITKSLYTVIKKHLKENIEHAYFSNVHLQHGLDNTKEDNVLFPNIWLWNPNEEYLQKTGVSALFTRW